MAGNINFYILISTVLASLLTLYLSFQNFKHGVRTKQDRRDKVEDREMIAPFEEPIESSFEDTKGRYLTGLLGRNKEREKKISVNNVYYFTVEERSYYAEVEEGRFLIEKTLNDLEEELDPKDFFRLKRDYIVNRFAILNYAYWENGKYIVRLDTPDRHEIVVPRARMYEFKEWLNWNPKEESVFY